MGQAIEVTGSTVLDETVLLDTDRNLSGMDGAGFESAEAAAAGSALPARLAEALFSADPSLIRVYVANNQVVARRAGGWDDAAVEAMAAEVGRFFVHYRD
jgi:hypothetical protein